MKRRGGSVCAWLPRAGLGQGRVKADSGLRGCRHKAAYTNQTSLRRGFEIPVRCPIFATAT